MNAVANTVKKLQALKLRGIAGRIDQIIDAAEKESVSYLDFLETVLEAEVKERTDRRLKRNLAMAHFPVSKRIESFEFGAVKGIEKRDVENLLDCRWIDQHENVLLFGPPGLGKTHLAIALGLTAVQKGYSVCYERMAGLIKVLMRSEIHRSSHFRLNRILKADLVIIDEIGYTPIERKEANIFFTLISDLYERTSIVITSNKSFSDWAEMMGDEVMTTALLDRLFHHARIFSLEGESYRISKGKGV